MTAATGPAVVLGVGNVLLGDDGVGVRLVEELRRLAADDPAAVPAGTRLVDGGTLGLGLLDAVRGARSLLLLDAVNLDQAAGTISILRGDAIFVSGGRGAATIPGSVGEILAAARLMGWLPDLVTLVGVQVGATGFGMGLSPRVESAVSRAVDIARTELRVLDERGAAGRPVAWAIRHQEEATA
jgi:hydrogenase maturation protease